MSLSKVLIMLHLLLYELLQRREPVQKSSRHPDSLQTRFSVHCGVQLSENMGKKKEKNPKEGSERPLIIHSAVTLRKVAILTPPQLHVHFLSLFPT